MSVEGPLPRDVDPRSRSRLPPVERDSLDEAGRAIYDTVAGDPQSLAGLAGPGGIRLRNPKLYALSRPVNRYLRFESDLGPRLREIAILATARECDSRFEWHAHETEAKRLGIEPELIDLIRHRADLGSRADAEATIVTLAREAIGERRVRPETYRRALAHFGAAKLVVLTELIASYSATAVLLTVFDQRVEPGTEVDFPPLAR